MQGAQGKVIIFSAPSGSGKTTIVHRILKQFKSLSFSVSATTRPIRGHEVDGIDYHFLSVEAFRERIEKGEFLEWEEVYEGRYYGSLKKVVLEMLEAGTSVVFDVDVVGGLNIKKYFGNRALAFFIQPPSLEVLRKRLEARNTEGPEEIERRLAKADQELQYRDEYDLQIINDDLEVAVAETAANIQKFLKNNGKKEVVR